MPRLATPRDADRVALLMERLHEELLPLGGDVQPGENTSVWVRKCIELALDGAGACVVEERDGEIVGASLAVEAKLPYDSRLSKRPVFGVGTYVDPSFRCVGVADGLYQAMKRELTALGYDGYRGGYLPENKRVQGVLRRNGAVDTEVSVLFRLGGDAC
jgi:GNAT superfamily N-acetyltransferase